MMGGILRLKALAFAVLYFNIVVVHAGATYSQLVDDGDGPSGSARWLIYGIFHALPIVLVAATFNSYFMTVLAALGMGWVAVEVGNNSYVGIDLFFVAVGLGIAIVGHQANSSAPQFPAPKKVEVKPPPTAPEKDSPTGGYYVFGLIVGLVAILGFIFSPTTPPRQAALLPHYSGQSTTSPAGQQLTPPPTTARSSAPHRDVRHCLSLKINAEIARCSQ